MTQIAKSSREDSYSEVHLSSFKHLGELGRMDGMSNGDANPRKCSAKVPQQALHEDAFHVIRND